MSDAQNITIVTGDKNWTGKTDRPVIAGSCRVRNELLKEGCKQVINPDKVLVESDLDHIYHTVAGVVGALNEACDRNGLEADKATGMTARAINSCFQGLARRKLFEKLGYGQNGNQDAANTSPSPREIIHSLSSSSSGHVSALERVLYFSRPYHFNFCSTTGKMLAGKGASAVMRISMAKKGASAAFTSLKNSAQSAKLLKPGTRIHYRLIIPAIHESTKFCDETLSGQLHELIGNELAIQVLNNCADYMRSSELARMAMDGLLRNNDLKPEIAIYNNMGRADWDGFARALMAHSVPVDFLSHGGLVVHGDDARKRITSVLSSATYNEPVNATRLIARSPLQVSREENRARIDHKVRLMPFEEVEKSCQESGSDRKFRLYLAPNFIRWFSANLGLTPTCFEIETCIKKLVSVVRELDDVEMFLRIKTAANDQGTHHNRKLHRGLLPEDVSDQFEPSRGIIDSTLGSHIALLEKSDVVITEGITAVMFEALEKRKPVLLINRSRSRIPSLPANRLIGAEPLGKRAAVYAASTEDNLGAIMAQLREAHMNKPLTDEELAEYVWVK